MDERVVVVGGAGVDTIVRVPSLPVPVVDSVLVGPIERYVGHSGAGYALGLHALEVPTTLVDLLGDDDEARLIRDRCDAVGLDLRSQHSPLGTKRSVNLVAPDGARVSFYDGRDPGQVVLETELIEPVMAEARLLHVTIHDWARPLMRRAVADGVEVSVDLQDWDGEREHHREFAVTADIVLMSAANLVDPEGTARWVRERGRARVVVVTRGAAGSAVLDEEGWQRVDAVTIADRPVVDSNGAGDAYGAAFLVGLLEGRSPVEAARMGAIAGAWACGSAGTHADPISRTRLRSHAAAPPPPAPGGA